MHTSHGIMQSSHEVEWAENLTKGENGDGGCLQNASGENHLVDASCQTDFVVVDVDLAELKRRMASGLHNNVEETLTAASIRNAAQSVVTKSGWVYDPRTKTYFDYHTNLYYYPQSRLYYNYKNGCYYRYNQESCKYEFHYQLESHKNQSQNLELLPRRQLTRERKQIEVKDHKLPNMKKFFIEFLKDRIRYVGGAVVTVDDGSAHTVDGDPIPCKLQRLENTNRGIKLSACRKELKGYYSDSETHRSRKKYKYHACKECQCLILPSCCRQNKPIKKRAMGKNLKSLQVSDSETARIKSIPTKYSRCLDCSGLASTSCCVETNYWCDPVHARPKKRARSGKKQKRRRKRPRYASSSSSVTENETLRDGLVSSNAATEGNKVDYTLDTHSEFQPNVTSETGMIPCIRAMVTSSQSIDIGTLFVITCNGAVIGSEETCDIQIDEDDVSGQHATVTYNPEQRNYFITDLGSDAGTTLNSTTENSPGVSAVIPIPVTHKSILLIGRCIFVLHLHPGYDTCDDCEPGQIKALLQQEQSQSRQISTGRDIQAARVSELQNLKKKYHLHRAEKTSIGPRYKDRAQERRKTVGSDNPYEKNEMPTSYDIELADHNKGRQMLEKMGWNKGKSLGKSQSGITEPIKPRGAGKSKFGLGFPGTTG